ncbi:MAG: alpha-glucan family phosphorylase, partial [Acidimicrobiia bacterium]|nr:alpha-glucan family phosphorylase [Acidimicrobiia bacterium]
LCAEFGIHATLPLYSGGLGVLAGDHVKAASDLGLPFIGVGLLYRRGYFRQAVDPDGQQQHNYGRVELVRRAFRRITDRTGRPLTVPIEFPGRTVHVGAWRLDVGRIPLIFLDTDIPENDPADRPITHMLYVRGREMRLCQEIVLGIGAVRVLAELGIEPSVWHVNEGHAAFSLLERVSRHVQEGEEFDDARKAVQQNTLFTLHTPVPAGNEVFDLGKVRRYIDDTLPGITEDMLDEFGRAREGDHQFDMGALAIRLSSITNGVSKRHGEVVTHDWSHLIGGPAEHVTNGVHTQTWTGRSIWRVFERTLGMSWTERLTDPAAWEAIRDVPNGDLWDAHT